MSTHATKPSPEEVVRSLYRSLDERRQPEDIAREIVSVLDLPVEVRKALYQVANSRQRGYWSSMSSDFARPVDMARQLEVAEQLFGHPVSFSAADLFEIEKWIRGVDQSIGKTFGKSDFQGDRLPKEERAKLGIELSRRQYNKRFRLAARLERKMQRLAREQFKRSLTLASKNRLASQITWDEFRSDLPTACFITYYVARCNLRSVFTNTSQVRPYDEICDALFQSCMQNANTTNWWSIAHVYPVTEVLAFLDDQQKGSLLGRYFDLLLGAAGLLEELWETNRFRDDMVVKRGNDSSTWNVTAGAWNKLRDGWFSLMYSLGLTDSIELVCPGKVLRLIAADVAYWHRATGGDVHPDTQIWKELPAPWEVLKGEKPCPRSLVEEVCRRHGVDPAKSGWTAPKPGRRVEKFTPTPELVHGVAISSPELASLFRYNGVFSGKSLRSDGGLTMPEAEIVDEVRSRHRLEQEHRSSEKNTE